MRRRHEAAHQLASLAVHFSSPQSGFSFSLSGSSRCSTETGALSISETEYLRFRSRNRRRREMSSRTRNPEPNPTIRQMRASSTGVQQSLLNSRKAAPRAGRSWRRCPNRASFHNLAYRRAPITSTRILLAWFQHCASGTRRCPRQPEKLSSLGRDRRPQQNV